MKNQYLLRKLEKLCSFPSVSGNEEGLVLWLKNKLEPYADEVWIDKVGNLIAIKGKPETFIFSHVDKVGYMVSEVTKSFVKVVPLSKGKAIPVKKKWPAVILSNFELETNLFSVKIGETHILKCTLNHNQYKKVSVGDFVALQPNFSIYKELIKSQGLDNKLGVLAASEVFKQSENIGLAFSVKEEAFRLGTKIAAQALTPKQVIVLDVTYDENPKKKYPIKAGKGPAICLKDTLLPDPQLVAKLKTTAVKYNLPFQLEVLESGGSDAQWLYDANGGTPFVFVGIPIQNMHTPFEAGSLRDLITTIKLLTLFFRK